LTSNTQVRENSTRFQINNFGLYEVVRIDSRY